MTVELVNGNYETSVFPGGEVHVRVTKAPEHVHIKALLANSEDVMRLLLLCDALKRMHREISILSIPYFPYARQDRVCNSGESFSVKVMADIINSIGAKKVRVLDVHSDVTPALLNNVDIHDTSALVSEFVGERLVICPDAGAEKRILKLHKPYVMATKVRDVSTGEIIATKVYGDVKGRDCLIVDDICDGGRTFVELAKVLRAQQANWIGLYVTHGIFSKGPTPFFGLLDNVYHYGYDSGEIKCLF